MNRYLGYSCDRHQIKKMQYWDGGEGMKGGVARESRSDSFKLSRPNKTTPHQTVFLVSVASSCMVAGSSLTKLALSIRERETPRKNLSLVSVVECHPLYFIGRPTPIQVTGPQSQIPTPNHPQQATKPSDFLLQLVIFKKKRRKREWCMIPASFTIKYHSKYHKHRTAFRSTESTMVGS